jgi:hypothetical protein
MGYKKTWDVSEISQEIYKMARECSSPYNDGYLSFEIKKDLYEIQLIINHVLKNCPTFSGEEEWLTEQEKKRIIKHLKT